MPQTAMHINFQIEQSRSGKSFERALILRRINAQINITPFARLVRRIKPRDGETFD